MGDSLSLTVFNKEIEIVSYPVQNFQGIYTVTHHNIKEHTHIHIFDGCFQNIYLFSDGAWKEMVEENKIKKSIKDILIRKDYQMCKSQYKNVGLGQYKNVGFPTFLYCLFSLHLL